MIGNGSSRPEAAGQFPPSPGHSSEQSVFIEREIAVVRPRTLGRSLSMIVLIKLEREGARTMEEMMRKLRAEPDVLEAWHTTGDVDIALKVVARDMAGCDDFAQRLFAADEDIRSFQTLVVIRELKASSPVPVSANG